MNILLIVMTTSTITLPLTRLSEKANEISNSSPENVEPLKAKYNDEIGNVTRAFNQMLASIKEYIEKIRTQMENESIMKEKSLLMETHLKDAQLKYLQAQINPHFLFNTLNAGAQLAMMEGADRTNEYIQNMADFFRYNVKKNNDVVTVSEEIELVDNYIYILDVRFSGDIKFSKQIDAELLNIRMPSMIIQPLVENSVKHGLCNLDESPGEISLALYREDDMACIKVSDNGIGMEQEVIDKIMANEQFDESSSEPKGIGVSNVMSRLSLSTAAETDLRFTAQSVRELTLLLKFLWSNDMYKVMLADDEGIVIDSLKFIIEKSFPGQCEIASAKTGRSVIELADSFRPDIAFMDIQMPV